MEYYTYVSTRADYDPCKTLLVLGPSSQIASLDAAARFAQSSGWQTLAEYDGAILVLPVLPQGYDGLDELLPGTLLGSLRNAFSSENGRSLFQRGGKLWTWETLVYLVGYDDGARFAGHCVMAEPARFAASALIGGAPEGYEALDRLSTHPFLPKTQPVEQRKNREIPCAIWCFGATEQQRALAEASFAESSILRFDTLPERYDLVLAERILREFFDTIIRWKDGPDGTLARHPGRVGFYKGDSFIQHSVTIGTVDYPVAVHLPKGKTEAEVRGLPLLFSVHGRGEPAWLFATKNGWDTLSDETGAFVLAVPDSPGNLWQLERDREAIPAMIDLLCKLYGLDSTRVYLTGFSNGAMMTRELSSLEPQRFAAISPWNGPVGLAGELSHPVFLPELAQSGCELPAWICVGDSDPAAAVASVQEQIRVLLPINGCKLQQEAESPLGYVPDAWRTGENWYTKERGYCQGERFRTAVYQNEAGEAYVCCTVMRDMPHGAIKEQSRAAWDFLRRFRRPEGSRIVEQMEETSC